MFSDPDRFHPTIDVGDDDTIVIEEDGGSPVDVSLPDIGDDVWVNSTTNSIYGGDFRGILGELEDAINAESSLNHTYSIDARTPDNSELTNSGIRISADGDFIPRVQDSDWTLDRRLLGWSSEFVINDQKSSHDSPYSVYGVWQSYTRFETAGPDDKRRRPRLDTEWSSTDMTEAYGFTWRAHDPRRFRYPGVPALHVWYDGDVRGDRDEFWESAGLFDGGTGVGDLHNTLESLWELARDGSEIVILHESDGLDLPEDNRERGVLGTEQARNDLTEWWTDVDRRGEFYDVQIQLEILESNYSY